MANKGLLGMNVFDAALTRMIDLYKVGHRIVVGFSGGKDSGVCVELCRAARTIAGRTDPVEVVMRDEEILFPGSFEYAERLAAEEDIKFYWVVMGQPIINVYNRQMPFFWVFDDRLQPEQWVRIPPKDYIYMPGLSINHLIRSGKTSLFPPPDERAWDKKLFFDPTVPRTIGVLGLRTSESPKRAGGLYMQGGAVSGPASDGAKFVWPIYDWQDGDIWKAVQDNKWDYNCNPAEAPIWMGDLRFKPIGEVRAGDEVIGWDRPDGEATRRLRKSRVIAVHKRVSQVATVRMTSGRTIRCTPDHLWLHAQKRCVEQKAHPERVVEGRLVGVKVHHRFPDQGSQDNFGPPLVGHMLVHVVDPIYPVGHQRTANWLAGIYDGEGSWDRIYQNEEANEAVHSAIGTALGILEIPFTKLNGNSAAQHGWRITGGRQSLLKFLIECSPIRDEWIRQEVLGQHVAEADGADGVAQVLLPEDGAEEEVYALETETGNYVAWGYASKNSAYDVMARMGVPKRRLRIAPPTITQAGVEQLKLASKAWPRWFDKVCERLPGVRQAANFGRRAIQPERRLGETWEQTFYRECVDNAPEWIAVRAQHEMEALLKRHATHSSAPFPDAANCPWCGTSGASYRSLTLDLYLGDPFIMRSTALKPINPDFFREGAGKWNDVPLWTL